MSAERESLDAIRESPEFGTLARLCAERDAVGLPEAQEALERLTLALSQAEADGRSFELAEDPEWEGQRENWYCSCRVLHSALADWCMTCRVAAPWMTWELRSPAAVPSRGDTPPR